MGCILDNPGRLNTTHDSSQKSYSATGGLTPLAFNRSRESRTSRRGTSVAAGVSRVNTQQRSRPTKLVLPRDQSGRQGGPLEACGFTHWYLLLTKKFDDLTESARCSDCPMA